jgi:N-acyl-D-amino-acid deacylase
MLGRYARDEKLLTLENAIRKMTSFPARKLGLTDRGLICEGMFADIVLFDDKTVLDTATYDNPHQFARGIRYVLVNGEIAIREGQYSEVRAGKVLTNRPYD